MELQGYLRMLRRGWVAIVLAIALGITAASLYLAVTPKQYGASTVLFVSANAPQSITDLQQGASFAGTAVISYAQIIDSGTVLAPVATELRPQQSVEQLTGSVSASVREETTLIDIAVTTSDPRSAAVTANAVAASATQILPGLQLAPNGRPLVRVEQIRPAVEPTAPSAPDPRRIIAIGLVVGLFAGLGGTIVRQSLDTRLRHGSDITPLTNVPLLAVVPRPRRGARNAVVARDDPMSTIGEAYRTLRTNLGSGAAAEPRSFVFASATAGHDAVEVPANLAWALAQSGRHVLLVDGDMRSSAIGDLFGVAAGSGLAEALVEDGRPVTHSTQNQDLRLLLSGHTTSSPSDLLSTAALGNLLRRLEQEYDTVVVHMPPLGEFADAAVLAASVDGTFITLGAGRSRAGDLTAALAALANVRVRPLGLVLVDADSSNRPTRSGGRPAPVPVPAAAPLDTPTLRQRALRPSPGPRYEASHRPNAATHPPWPV